MKNATLVAELRRDLDNYYDALMDLIGVDENHEFMKENKIFSNLFDLYHRIDEVEDLIQLDDELVTAGIIRRMIALSDEYKQTLA